MAQSTPTASLGWQDFFTTTLDGSITSTDTTISLANAPTPTEGFLVIEPDSSTNREIIMYTSVSGNDVVCGSVDDRGIGGTTARAHSSGAIVKMNTVSDMFEALQSGNGLSSAFALPSGAVDPEDLVAGTGTSWAWQSFTPTWTGSSSNPAIGDGTIAAKYIQIGKTVFFRIKITFGSTSTVGSGNYILTLPVTAATAYAQNDPIGVYQGEDVGSASNSGITVINTTGTLRAFGNTSTKDVGLVGHAYPYAWGNGDILRFSGSYEAA